MDWRKNFLLNAKGKKIFDNHKYLFPEGIDEGKID